MADTFTDAIEAGAGGGPRFSQEGLDLVRTFEGFRPDAYYDLGKNKGTLTVGYGFTKADIPDLKPGYKMDKSRAEQLLPSLLNRKYGPTIIQNVKVPLSDQQYSALTSFAYNVGPTAFKQSTLLKKLNSGDFNGAASEFDRWIFAGGKPVDGLARRRAAEKALFMGDTQNLGRILEGQKFGGMGADLSQASQPAENKWEGFEERMKALTESLPEPPSVTGEKKEGTAVAQATDPFSELPPSVPEDQKPKSETSTVNALLKLAGKEPIDLSGAGSDVKIDFKVEPGDLFAGLAKTLGQGLTNYFSQGGAFTPMPDNPEEMAKSQMPFAQNVNFNTSMPNVQAGLPRMAGLAPRRMG
jgi:lysozyme